MTHFPIAAIKITNHVVEVVFVFTSKENNLLEHILFSINKNEEDAKVQFIRFLR